MVTQMTVELAQMWGTLGRKVISTVLVDHGALFPLLDVLGQNVRWFSPKESRIWAGVLQCHEENLPPTVEAVALRCDAEPGYVQAVANQWSEEDGKRVLYYADELKQLGMLADLRSLGRELSALDEPTAIPTAIEYATARLSGVLASQTARQGDAYSVGEAAWEELESKEITCFPTGLQWFDDLTGGIWPGFNYWIVGAYKKGKTTLMRNMILNIAESGVPCDAYCAEGSREMFALDCQAMIATRLLCERGERTPRNLRLSGLFLRRVWRKRAAILRREELEAINEAREIWNGLNVRVWDTVDGIRNLATLRHRVQQSKCEYGSFVHWLDYSQLFGEGKTLFERQSKTALAAQEIAQSQGVAVCILAQRNEASISGSDGYSVGVKGGGDASAAADFLLVPDIDHELESVFHVKLKHSRHTGLGQGQHTINGSSGLILDRWLHIEPREIYL